MTDLYKEGKLSVIMPWCNEWPQVVFTVANIHDELKGRVDFEFIAVDNYCDEVKAQKRGPDRSHEYMEAVDRGHQWLKVVKYNKKLSHWQAKNAGVEASEGEFLWFVDAHCHISRDSLYNMYTHYQKNWREMKGTLHLPLTYSILEWRKLIYCAVAELERYIIHYRFCSYRPSDHAYQVPCMSTCGMMMHRSIYDKLGGWPAELGIYGGGENFINYTLATMGMNVWIFPVDPLRHHGEKRGYSWNYNDYHRNRCIASYMYGGEEWALGYIMKCKGNQLKLKQIGENVLETCQEHREHVAKSQVIPIKEWVQREVLP